jgi:signal peptidase I
MKKPQIKQTEDTEGKSNRNIFQEYSEALIVAIILAILIRGCLVQAFKIPSSSMEPTLLVGDHILVSKFIYGIRIPFTGARWPHFKDPKPGDVVVFIYPDDRSKDFIKRVIAVGGDTVESRNKHVFVDGKEVVIPQARALTNAVLPADRSQRDNFGPIKVPKDHLFVMGDNRDHSQDSRFWGFVPVQDVKGEAFLIYYSSPFEEKPTTEGFRVSPWNRLHRFFNIIR